MLSLFLLGSSFVRVAWFSPLFFLYAQLYMRNVNWVWNEEYYYVPSVHFTGSEVNRCGSRQISLTLLRLFIGWIWREKCAVQYPPACVSHWAAVCRCRCSLNSSSSSSTSTSSWWPCRSWFPTSASATSTPPGARWWVAREAIVRSARGTSQAGSTHFYRSLCQSLTCQATTTYATTNTHEVLCSCDWM